MPKRHKGSPEASQGVPAHDPETISASLPTRRSQRSQSSSDHARQHDQDTMPLLGLESASIEKSGFNLDQQGDSNQQPRLAPLLGTNTAQITVNVDKSSSKRSPRRACYGVLLGFLPKAMLLRGHQFYYRHIVPVTIQSLLNHTEFRRSLRTDSLRIALRRLPGFIARIEIEHARDMAGLPVDVALCRLLQDQWASGLRR